MLNWSLFHIPHSCSYLRNKVLPRLGLGRRGPNRSDAVVVSQTIQVRLRLLVLFCCISNDSEKPEMSVIMVSIVWIDSFSRKYQLGLHATLLPRPYAPCWAWHTGLTQTGMHRFITIYHRVVLLFIIFNPINDAMLMIYYSYNANAVKMLLQKRGPWIAKTAWSGSCGGAEKWAFATSHLPEWSKYNFVTCLFHVRQNRIDPSLQECCAL